MKQTAKNHARIVSAALEKAMEKRGKNGVDSEETINELKGLSNTIFANIKEANEYIEIMNKSSDAIHNHLSSCGDNSVFSKTEATYS